ncbi:MAG: FAD-binding oxidoreductase [Pseudomonadota bacterium]
MTDSQPISLWDRSAVEERYDAALPEGARADVAIVGGGYTGLSTALHGAERGLDCLVLEAEEIGFGGSGRNAGMLNAGMWLPPQDVIAELGEDLGRRVIDAFGRAPDYVKHLIERHQIRCELTQTGSIHAAHAPKGYENLRRRAEGWAALGAPVRLLSREEAAEKIGSQHFSGGLLDERAGSINPMGYVRGLARAARGAGARIATGVRVTGLVPEAGGWRVETDKGPVAAKQVVLGTNAYTDQLWPGLAGTYSAIHYFQLATEPLGERVAHILPERQPVWDTGQIMLSVRRDMSDRLIIGSMGTIVKGVSDRFAARQLRRLFPELGPVRIETAWHGRIALTHDHVPKIHRLADGLYTGIGYNGRGITTGTIVGRALGAVLAGEDADLPLPFTDVRPEPRRRLNEIFFQTAFTANQIWKSL